MADLCDPSYLLDCKTDLFDFLSCHKFKNRQAQWNSLVINWSKVTDFNLLRAPPSKHSTSQTAC